MAATGKTPILLYGSTTPTNVPSAGNLTNSSDGCEIAINVADKNLFFKDSTNAVNTVPIRQSSGSSDGWLSSANWTTFNSKQAAYTNLTTIGSLANATGWLYNNGSGTFSYSTPSKSDVGLGNVTNDAQTKAAIVPNTAPSVGQILVGNAGGTAYAPVSMSGDATLASTGAATLATVNSNVGSYTNASVTVNAKGLVTAVSSGTAPVTSVTGTAPVVSSGGTTPAISMAAATGSVNGYLTSTDWTTFNSKVSSQWVTSGSNIYYTTGKVGIGLANGSSNLEVAGTGANNAGAKATYEGTIKINEAGGSSLATTGGLEFKCSVFGSGYGAKIYATDNGTLLFGGRSNSATWTQTAQMTTGGDFTLNTGNLVIGTSGKGIDFSATADATATSELLADYEEGTFTPVIQGSTSAGTGTYNTQLGTYTKVGRCVTYSILLDWSAHTGTGNIQVAGLPYTAGTTYYWAQSLWTTSLALTASNYLQGYIAGNTTYVRVMQYPVGGGFASDVAMDTAAQIMVTGQYYT